MVSVSEDLHPIVSVVNLNKFDRDVLSCPKIHLISRIRVSLSCVIEDCLLLDVYWEVVCCPPMNSLVC